MSSCVPSDNIKNMQGRAAIQSTSKKICLALGFKIYVNSK